MQYECSDVYIRKKKFFLKKVYYPVLQEGKLWAMHNF